MELLQRVDHRLERPKFSQAVENQCTDPNRWICIKMKLTGTALVSPCGIRAQYESPPAADNRRESRFQGPMNRIDDARQEAG